MVGPGSLYTSLLPNLLVPDLAEALRASRAMKFFVCNVATQPVKRMAIPAATMSGRLKST